MKKTMMLGVVAALAMALAGCATETIVSQPSRITLENALKSVGQGLYDMKEAQKDVKTGLIPSEVTVTFNITASGSDDGKLYVEVSSNPAGGGTAKAGAEYGSKLSAQRGNQITVKFTNLLLADKERLVSVKKPEEIEALLKQLPKGDIEIYTNP